MPKAETVIEKETCKVILDFRIETSHLILARRPGQMLINKKEKLKI